MIMEKKLEQLKNKVLLDVYSQGGFGRSPGICGTIITDDKKVYTYYNFIFIPDSFKDKGIPKSTINFIRTIDDEEYEEIEKMIEVDIIGKENKTANIRDVSYYIEGIYKGKKFRLRNAIDKNGNGLYFKISKFIEKYKSKIRDEK